jgi:GDP-L-fucose synthase
LTKEGSYQWHHWAGWCVSRFTNQRDRFRINVGAGEDVTIDELAQLIGRIVGFNGEIRFDRTKPDGTPRKLLDVSRLNALGWRARTLLEDGVRATYGRYLSNLNARGV